VIHMATEPKTPAVLKTTVKTEVKTKAKADSKITSDSGVAVFDIPFPISVTTSTVNIIAPPNNGFVSPRDTLVGNASAFEQTTDNESGQIIEEHDATGEITSVTVQAAAIGTVNAVATGPAGRPWATWSFALSSLPAGPVAIHVKVTPNTFTGPGADRQLTVDAAAPSLTVNPPADVLRPAPPYIATLTGTASDNASGVAAVEWQLGGSGLRAASGTTNWSAEVVLPGLGTFTVAVQARDNVGM
jgi:hypothetical protein